MNTKTISILCTNSGQRPSSFNFPNGNPVPFFLLCKKPAYRHCMLRSKQSVSITQNHTLQRHWRRKSCEKNPCFFFSILSVALSTEIHLVWIDFQDFSSPVVHVACSTDKKSKSFPRRVLPPGVLPASNTDTDRVLLISNVFN